jgi:DNA-binding transcriptional LysR family regulator
MIRTVSADSLDRTIAGSAAERTTGVSLRQLEYFVTVVDERSFTRAAERLFVTQPGLSHQIRALEASLGGRLLERLPRSVSLTPLGRAVLEDARLAVRSAIRVSQQAEALAAGTEGELQIATVMSVAGGVLPKALRPWHERYPGIVTKLHEFSHKAALEEAVASGLADVAVGPRPVAWDGPVLSLGSEEFVIILSKDDPLVDGSGTIDLKELAQRQWVLYNPDHGLSQIVSHVCSGAGFVPRGTVQTWQVEAAAHIAAAGLGPALVPDNSVPEGLDAAVLHLRKPVRRELAAFARSHVSVLAQAFLDVLVLTDLNLYPVPSGARARPDIGLLESSE